MATHGNKPDLDDLKARLGLKPTAKPGGPTAGPPRGTVGPPGAQNQAPAPSVQPIQQPVQQQQPAPRAASPVSGGHPGLGNLPGASLGASANVGPNAKPVVAPEPVAPVQQQPDPYAYQEPAYQQPAQQPKPVEVRGPSKPPAQVGPPATARPQRREPAFNPAELPVGNVDIDETAGQRSTFSPAFIAVGAGVLFVGLVLGYFAASSSQARTLYTAQTTAAQKVKKRLDPSVADAKKATAMVIKLGQNPTTVDHKTPKAVMGLKFVPRAGAINALVGGTNVYNINQFMAKATVLRQMVKRHNHLTNVVDKKELEELVKNNKIMQGNKKFAVIYNYKTLLNHLKSKKKDDAFKPTGGRLVVMDSWKVDEEGMVEFTNLNNNQKDKYSVKGVVPLDASEILKSGGQNALQRYSRRVKTLAFYATDLQKSYKTLMPPIDKLASRGSAPLIQFGSSPDADPTPSTDAAPEAPAEKKE